MHQRRVSRHCSFFDLASIALSDDQDAASVCDRVEAILKIVDTVVSTDDVEAIRHRVNVGDIVHVRCLVECPQTSDTNVLHEINSEGQSVVHALLHVRAITIVDAWKETHPGTPFVPVPTAHPRRQPNAITSEEVQGTPHAVEPAHCKFWLNTGSCQNGDRCEYYHIPKAELKEARARWLQERLKRRREHASQDDDPHDAHGKQSKNQRAGVFVQWLVDTFGSSYLSSGSGVLDIAGGRGNVSFDLWNVRHIPSTLIDPRPLKLSRVQHKHLKKLKKADGENANTGLVPQKQALFNTDTFLENADNVKLITNASVLVGMHPDEATDAIVDVALQFDKPFAIVPCCVFSHSFPDRRMPNGVDKVLTYDSLVEYLLAKSPDIQKAFLPFDGKNLILYRLPK